MPEIILLHIAWFIISMFIYVASSFAIIHKGTKVETVQDIKRIALFESLQFVGDIQMLAVAVSLAITFVLHNFDPLFCIGLSNLFAIFIHRIMN